MMMKNFLATRSKLAAGGALLASVLIGASLPAQAGSLYLTGHDVDFHDNQAGYDTKILSYLTGLSDLSAVTVSYLHGSGGVINPPSTGVIKSYDVNTMSDADWATALTSKILEIGSEASCGGCTIAAADITKIASRKTQVIDYFNAGGSIWGNTSANVPGYYDSFLPLSLISTTAPLGTSSGFYTTPEGAAIGIVNANINGYPTHNSFANIPSVFTVFEKLSTTAGVQSESDRIISIGLRDGSITGGGGTGGTIVTGSTAVPEPFTIVGTLIGATVAFRTRQKLKATNKL